ncbi:hypothetical protein GCM10010166_47710 [Couchioplanes caeruleus subsp. azureus]|nr:hypothetical protein GCM10010166_47710 [Couchioplanes caeruleus subsp. azureus]
MAVVVSSVITGGELAITWLRVADPVNAMAPMARRGAGKDQRAIGNGVHVDAGPHPVQSAQPWVCRIGVRWVSNRLAILGRWWPAPRGGQADAGRGGASLGTHDVLVEGAGGAELSGKLTRTGATLRPPALSPPPPLYTGRGAA